MKELTNEQIARVFAMYYGAKVLVTNEKYINGYYIGILKGLQHDSPFVEREETGSDGYEKLEDCKLLLTPLSAMSDEDAVEFCKLNRYTKGENVEVFVKVAKDIIDRISNPGNYEHTPMCYPYDAYQYLIQKSYAVPLFIAPNHPANGQDAIGLGLAIDRTKKEAKDGI